MAVHDVSLDVRLGVNSAEDYDALTNRLSIEVHRDPNNHDLDKWRVRRPTAGLPSMAQNSKSNPAIVKHRSPTFSVGDDVVFGLVPSRVDYHIPVFIGRVLRLFEDKDRYAAWMRVRWYASDKIVGPYHLAGDGAIHEQTYCISAFSEEATQFLFIHWAPKPVKKKKKKKTEAKGDSSGQKEIEPPPIFTKNMHLTKAVLNLMTYDVRLVGNDCQYTETKGKEVNFFGVEDEDMEDSSEEEEELVVARPNNKKRRKVHVLDTVVTRSLTPLSRLHLFLFEYRHNYINILRNIFAHIFFRTFTISELSCFAYLVSYHHKNPSYSNNLHGFNMFCRERVIFLGLAPPKYDVHLSVK